MFLQVKWNAKIGEHKLVRVRLVYPGHGVPQRGPVFDEFAPRVDEMVFLVCYDDVQGGLATRMAAPAAIVGFVWRAPVKRSNKMMRVNK